VFTCKKNTRKLAEKLYDFSHTWGKFQGAGILGTWIFKEEENFMVAEYQGKTAINGKQQGLDFRIHFSS
jgi:hypothetical protein